jgi:hypothetical protein
MTTSKKLLAQVLTAGLLAFGAAQAKADSVFDLTWSGAPFGNTATATGTITLNLADIVNPGATFQSVTPFVTDFTITIAGASSGNGTFNFPDFNGPANLGGFYLVTAGMLNFTNQLVGQPTPGGPWGSTNDGSTGDFNVFSNFSDPSAPVGDNFFTIRTDGRTGDQLYLTSFVPAVSTPEPAAAIHVSALLLALVLGARQRSRPWPS